MKNNNNNSNNQINFDPSLLEEIDINQLIYEIDASKDFKLYEVEENSLSSTILIKIFKKVGF